MSDVPSRSVLLYVLLACSLTANVVLVLTRPSVEQPAAVEVLDEDALAEDIDSSDPAEVETAQPTPAAAHDSAAPSADWTLLRGNVEQSLARTFQAEGGKDGDALSSVYTRLFVWDLDLRRDMQKGDSVAVVWRKGADGFPEIAAASLQSKKLGRTLTAFRWKSPQDPYPSYWYLDGTEAPLRLREGPLSQYEQITSLLKDRPTHKGMDFKTPVGTEVKVPRAGKVTRVNWNWTANGNCIEVLFEDGVLAKFLHLSENRVTEGQRVSAGQVIALTGNTGRSTAPHLHYQLDRGDTTLDPLDYHGTDRRSLSPEQVAALKRDVATFERMLNEPVVR